MGLLLENLQILQQIENASVSLLTLVGYRDHITCVTTAPLAANLFPGTI